MQLSVFIARLALSSMVWLGLGAPLSFSGYFR
jgi:hypothetical protein